METSKGSQRTRFRLTNPGWTVWDGPWERGETPVEVTERADRVVARVLALPRGSTVLLFSHQHFLRVLTARWLRQPVSMGRLLALVTGTVSVLGWERANPVIRHWSVPPGGLSSPASRSLS